MISLARKLKAVKSRYLDTHLMWQTASHLLHKYPQYEYKDTMNPNNHNLIINEPQLLCLTLCHLKSLIGCMVGDEI